VQLGKGVAMANFVESKSLEREVWGPGRGMGLVSGLPSAPMHDNGSLMRLHGLGLSKAPPGTWDEISLETIQYMTGSQLICDSGIQRSNFRRL
jgi:hypothetical protein